jgi:dienelactone hydrolase
MCLAVSAAAALRQGDFHSPEAAREELAAFAAATPDAASWKSRAATIRAGILKGAGLDPLPRRMPLNAVAGPERLHNDYIAQNVRFESLPGFFVTGTLYRPAAGAGPFAGVLLPHGHFRGADGGRFQPELQVLAATLARSGAVVFAYDMVGWGESTQFPHKHPTALTLQLWNSMRALDYLESRADVDRTRLAATGASGGGTQTFLLAAVDDRVAVSVPVVQVSAHFFGGCECESGLPIHEGDGYVSNNAEIAALAAPRPQLIVSDGKDWTQNVPRVEFPYISRAYSLLGAESVVANAHFADEGHDYGPSKQAAAIAFLARHLHLDTTRATAADGRPVLAGIEIEPPETMHNFTSDSPRPADAPSGVDAVTALLAPVQKKD